jgi:hypothetical protein
VTRLRKCSIIGVCCLLAAASGTVRADEEPAKPASPWLLLPTFSNNPKLGASVGGLGAYLRKFDAQSQVSMFSVSAQYTSTDSATLGAFARVSFAGDQHRILVRAYGGLIKNDYDNFLGTGIPLKSEDHMRSLVGRYLYRLENDWFVGAQAVSTNYQIVGQTSLDEDLLGFLGLTGFKAGGIGLVAYHDSRDLQDAWGKMAIGPCSSRWGTVGSSKPKTTRRREAEQQSQQAQALAVEQRNGQQRNTGTTGIEDLSISGEIIVADSTVRDRERHDLPVHGRAGHRIPMRNGATVSAAVVAGRCAPVLPVAGVWRQRFRIGQAEAYAAAGRASAQREVEQAFGEDHACGRSCGLAVRERKELRLREDTARAAAADARVDGAFAGG